MKLGAVVWTIYFTLWMRSSVQQLVGINPSPTSKKEFFRVVQNNRKLFHLISAALDVVSYESAQAKCKELDKRAHLSHELRFQDTAKLITKELNFNLAKSCTFESKHIVYF